MPVPSAGLLHHGTGSGAVQLTPRIHRRGVAQDSDVAVRVGAGNCPAARGTRKNQPPELLVIRLFGHARGSSRQVGSAEDVETGTHTCNAVETSVTWACASQITVEEGPLARQGGETPQISKCRPALITPTVEEEELNIDGDNGCWRLGWAQRKGEYDLAAKLTTDKGMELEVSARRHFAKHFNGAALGRVGTQKRELEFQVGYEFTEELKGWEVVARSVLTPNGLQNPTFRLNHAWEF